MSSFLDDIIDVGSGLWKSFTGSGTGPAIARATALGFLLKEVTDSINKDNQKPSPADTNKPDAGVRLQVQPDTQHAVPVVYGDAWLGGIVTDAQITNSNQTMWYCLTLCEKTGTLLSNGQSSVITFRDMYWDRNKITFQADGITVASFTDPEGNVDTNPAGLIKIYCFNGGSTSPTVPYGYTNGSLNFAYGLFPNWSTNHTMSNLVFALVRIDYNAEKNTTGLGDIEFRLSNSMNKPGDCIYDYMTNTRYGAGINPTEIYSS